nr:MAG: capsid protein [Skomarfal virus 18]
MLDLLSTEADASNPSFMNGHSFAHLRHPIDGVRVVKRSLPFYPQAADEPTTDVCDCVMRKHKVGCPLRQQPAKGKAPRTPDAQRFYDLKPQGVIRCFDHLADTKENVLLLSEEVFKELDDSEHYFFVNINPKKRTFQMKRHAIAPPRPRKKPSPTTVILEEEEYVPRRIFEPHSEDIIASASLAHQEIVTGFDDKIEDWISSVDNNCDSTYGVLDNVTHDLNQLLSRPIKIHTDQWSDSIHPVFTLDPWKLFLQQKIVANRISNFRGIRGKLNIKVTLNGTPFHYGRLLATYYPLLVQDRMSTHRTNALAGVDCVEASQRMHLYLDPTTSQGGTLELPFVYQNNYLDLNEDPLSLGSLILYEIAPLKHINASTDPVTINYYAWMTDVKLVAPTTHPLKGLVPQSGDEYGTGIVSRPAFILAHIAGASKKVPMIKPYAMAAEMTMNALGTVAKLFGYSRPVVSSDTRYIKIETIGNLANTDAEDTTHKLSLDTKQAVTVDSRTVGLSGKDEMALASIWERESFITTFTWTKATTPGKLLWNTAVTPEMFKLEKSTGKATGIHATAMHYAVSPFRYWRGSIVYRFQIVSSAFHNGRIRVCYDPADFIALDTMNTVRNEIIDISVHRDFTVTVGYNALTPYLGTTHNVTTEYFSPTAVATPDNLTFNGVLSLVVENDLTTPNSTANGDIEIIVSCWAGDDFEVNTPESVYMNNKVLFKPQSGNDELGVNFSRPEGAPLMATFSPILTDKETPLITHGDPVTSVRTLIKRYTLHSYVTPDTTSLDAAVEKACRVVHGLPAFPQYGGATSIAQYAVTKPAAGKWEFANLTPLNYFAPCYIGWRGGIRNRFVINGDASYAHQAFTATRLQAPLLASATSLIPTLTDTDTVRASEITGIPIGWSGKYAQDTNQGNVVDVEIPYSSVNRFNFAKTDLMRGNGVQLHLEASLSKKNAMKYERYVAGGDDLTFFWYQAPPVLYEIVTTPS